MTCEFSKYGAERNGGRTAVVVVGVGAVLVLVLDAIAHAVARTRAHTVTVHQEFNMLGRVEVIRGDDVLIESYLEEYWAAQDLPNISLYGWGAFVPGAGYAPLLTAYRCGRLAGVVGMYLTAQSLADIPAPVREAAGRFMRLAPLIFVVDEQSKDWLAHYGLEGAVREHPAWLDLHVKGGIVSSGWEEAVHAAASGEPFVLSIPFEEAQGSNHLKYHPLVRFAQKYNCTENLVIGEPEDLVLDRLQVAPALLPITIQHAREDAKATLDEIAAAVRQRNTASTPAGAVSVLLGHPATGAATAPLAASPPPSGRVMHVGDVFDPETHYGPEYYAEGGGIAYPGADHTWKRYNGPGRDWQAFTEVGQILRRLLPGKHSLVSLGCGYGYDVARFLAVGWDAYGIDLSPSAVKGAPPSVRSRIFCADVTKQLPQRRFDVVCTFDFWEHIWERDRVALTQGVWALLEPRGIMVNIIATRSLHEADAVYEPGVVVTPENAWLLVSGHVNVRTWGWWVSQFMKDELFKPRLDLCQLFQAAWTEIPAAATVGSWTPKNLVIMERGE